MLIGSLVEVVAQAEQLGSVVSKGSSGLPLKILGTNGNGIDSHLDTLVTHLTYVGQCLVVEVWWNRHVVPPKHINGLLAVNIDVTPDAIAEYGKVETDIILG